MGSDRSTPPSRMVFFKTTLSTFFVTFIYPSTLINYVPSPLFFLHCHQRLSQFGTPFTLPRRRRLEKRLINGKHFPCFYERANDRVKFNYIDGRPLLTAPNHSASPQWGGRRWRSLAPIWEETRVGIIFKGKRNVCRGRLAYELSKVVCVDCNNTFRIGASELEKYCPCSWMFAPFEYQTMVGKKRIVGNTLRAARLKNATNSNLEFRERATTVEMKISIRIMSMTARLHRARQHSPSVPQPPWLFNYFMQLSWPEVWCPGNNRARKYGSPLTTGAAGENFSYNPIKISPMPRRIYAFVKLVASRMQLHSVAKYDEARRVARYRVIIFNLVGRRNVNAMNACQCWLTIENPVLALD